MKKTAEENSKLPKVYKLPSAGLPVGYVSRIRVFNRYAREKVGKKEINEQTVLDFFEMLSRTKQPNTVNTYIYSIKAAYRKISERTYQLFKIDNFFKQIEHPKLLKRVSPGKVVTIADLKKAIEDEEPRWKVLILFIFNNGLRVSEARNLRWIDIKELNGIMECHIRGKGNKSRVIYISKKFCEEIRSVFRSEIYVFEFNRQTPFHPDSVRKRLKTCFKEKLNRNFTTHWLRHSQANLLLSQGFSIRGVADLLGHSSPDITSAHYDQSEITADAKLGLEVSAFD